MLYKYTVTTLEGEKSSGSIEAASMEIAINSLQARNFIVISIKPAESGAAWLKKIKIFNRVKTRDVVVLSRQLSTLFEAKVPTLTSLKLLSTETENPVLKDGLLDIVNDIQGGISISQAMSKHPNIFSPFYSNMVKSGEESGKLDEAFSYLADYLERSYELSSKAKNALVYPAFIILTLVIVMILMLVFVIPHLTAILTEVGQELPIYTKVIIGISDFARNYGIFVLIAFVAGVVFLWRYAKTETGRMVVSRFQLSVPIVGNLYRKFYVSRLTDNLETSLSSGISVVRVMEIAADVVGNAVYAKILMDAANDIKTGSSLSASFSRHKEIPQIVSQMIKIGEESGKLNFILKTLGRFYKKEVDNAVDTLVSLIEPVLIIVLGLGVGFFIVAIIGPIYSMTAGM